MNGGHRQLQSDASTLCWTALLILLVSFYSGVSEPQVAENRYLPSAGGITLTTVYALMCYPVMCL